MVNICVADFAKHWFSPMPFAIDVLDRIPSIPFFPWMVLGIAILGKLSPLPLVHVPHLNRNIIADLSSSK